MGGPGWINKLWCVVVDVIDYNCYLSKESRERIRLQFTKVKEITQRVSCICGLVPWIILKKYHPKKIDAARGF